ncbi:hypothetical protein [Shinella kummerowiae]|uniref:hypothetical protein n=1 Tax=Shinella kummerowiae TaxID=417745 RepID=UPI0021B5B38A|nr:hypothetical protein [Shinella kummerowiae]MCT7667639.1 hypothetical protein [Shinella kummerowiae]
MSNEAELERAVEAALVSISTRSLVEMSLAPFRGRPVTYELVGEMAAALMDELPSIRIEIKRDQKEMERLIADVLDDIASIKAAGGDDAK